MMKMTCEWADLGVWLFGGDVDRCPERAAQAWVGPPYHSVGHGPRYEAQEPQGTTYRLCPQHKALARGCQRTSWELFRRYCQGSAKAKDLEVPSEIRRELHRHTEGLAQRR